MRDLTSKSSLLKESYVSKYYDAYKLYVVGANYVSPQKETRIFWFYFIFAPSLRIVMPLIYSPLFFLKPLHYWLVEGFYKNWHRLCIS